MSWFSAIKNGLSSAVGLGKQMWNSAGALGKKVTGALHSKKLGSLARIGDVMTDGVYGLSKNLNNFKNMGKQGMQKYNQVDDVMSDRPPRRNNFDLPEPSKERVQPNRSNRRDTSQYQKDVKPQTIERERKSRNSDMFGNMFA